MKVLLIGGTSHVGKSTWGERLAREQGWRHLSTDQLARHPGRPWRSDQQPLPDDVIDHYSGRHGDGAAEALVAAVLHHYRHNVWPIVAALVRSHVNNPFDPGLVLEGSAILPDQALVAQFARCHGVWLTAADATIRERLLQESRYDTRNAGEQRLIEAFLGRTLAFDGQVTAAARRNGQPVLDTGAPGAYNALLDSIRTPA